MRASNEEVTKTEAVNGLSRRSKEGYDALRMPSVGGHTNSTCIELRSNVAICVPFLYLDSIRVSSSL